MSLYERVVKAIESIKSIEPEAAIEILYRELTHLLSGKGIFFPVRKVQVVRVDDLGDYVIIEVFLESVEVWVKIRKDGSVDASIYATLYQCVCDCCG